jgi:hypothetical protein
MSKTETTVMLFVNVVFNILSFLFLVVFYNFMESNKYFQWDQDSMSSLEKSS